MIETDVVVIGGGIAGLAATAAIAPRQRVVLVEREPDLFLHTSGRSAQQAQPTYGPAPIRRFTAETLRLLDRLPESLVSPRPLLWLDLADRPPHLHELHEEIQGLRALAVDDAVALFPPLRAESVSSAALDAASVEVDVPALRERLRSDAIAAGARILLGAVVVAARRDADRWRIDTPTEALRARAVVVAAGPWADDTARLFGRAGFGLVPTRRTVVVAGPDGEAVDPMAPMLMDAASTFYLRPYGSAILASTLEDEPSIPEDAQPREETIERTLEVVNRITRLALGRPERSWTGLRTVSPDGLPIIGWDGDREGLYWLVGQGGYGIQTSLGLAAAVADQLSGESLTLPAVADLAAFSPARFDR